jgi:hypothetical protein
MGHVLTGRVRTRQRRPHQTASPRTRSPLDTTPRRRGPVSSARAHCRCRPRTARPLMTAPREDRQPLQNTRSRPPAGICQPPVGRAPIPAGHRPTCDIAEPTSRSEARLPPWSPPAVARHARTCGLRLPNAAGCHTTATPSANLACPAQSQMVTPATRTPAAVQGDPGSAAPPAPPTSIARRVTAKSDGPPCQRGDRSVDSWPAAAAALPVCALRGPREPSVGLRARP